MMEALLHSATIQNTTDSSTFKILSDPALYPIPFSDVLPIIQAYYPSCLDFYWPVFGAWLCGGLVRKNL
jgi:hypothetical protein